MLLKIGKIHRETPVNLTLTPVNLTKVSGTGVFQCILLNFQGQPFYRTPLDECFCTLHQCIIIFIDVCYYHGSTGYDKYIIENKALVATIRAQSTVKLIFVLL